MEEEKEGKKKSIEEARTTESKKESEKPGTKETKEIESQNVKEEQQEQKGNLNKEENQEAIKKQEAQKTPPKTELKPEEPKAEKKQDKEKPKIPFYERWHKLFIVIPLLILIISLAFLGLKWLNGQELIKKDVSLTGGITLTVYYGKSISLADLEKKFSAKFPDVTIRKLSEVGTGKQIGLIFETSKADKADIDAFKQEVESNLQIKLTNKNSSLEFTGPLLGKSFFRQLIRAFIIAFLFIIIVVLVIFRVFIPSFIAVFSIFSDALITLAILSAFNFHLSSAGIAAFLMLIGYSIDTDILLTTRILKRKEKDFNTRLKEAAKTGLTMTFTSLIVILVAYFLLISPIFKEIFLILIIGLSVDIMNTWLFNASVLKIYWDKKEKQIK